MPKTAQDVAIPEKPAGLRELDVQAPDSSWGVELMQGSDGPALFVDIGFDTDIENHFLQGGSIAVENIDAVEDIARAMLEAVRQWRSRGFTEPWPD
jgi:hypothetical protein